MKEDGCLRFFRYVKGVVAELADSHDAHEGISNKTLVEGPDFIGHDGSFDDVIARTEVARTMPGKSPASMGGV